MENSSTRLGQETLNSTIVRNDIKGRLLTPEEGCGFSKVAHTHTRIVGGGPAENGAWPWLALLGFKYFGVGLFICGK